MIVIIIVNVIAIMIMIMLVFIVMTMIISKIMANISSISPKKKATSIQLKSIIIQQTA